MRASDTGTDIKWFKGVSFTPLASDDSYYTIVTTMATQTEADMVTKISSSVLSILNFDSADVASYSCRADYHHPILDDESAEQAMKLLRDG